MTMRIRRRQFLLASAATAGSLVLPGKAPAQGGARTLSGTTLNIACWSAPYAKLVAEYIPEFEAATGAKVNYETPSFPIYNQRIDVELSTHGAAYDVLNVTFIYVGRWLGAEWFTTLNEFYKDPSKTPADWDIGDFLPGAVNTSGRCRGLARSVPAPRLGMPPVSVARRIRSQSGHPILGVRWRAGPGVPGAAASRVR
jgi:multiple sugar transport system substrate-binding protein